MAALFLIVLCSFGSSTSMTWIITSTIFFQTRNIISIDSLRLFTVEHLKLTDNFYYFNATIVKK